MQTQVTFRHLKTNPDLQASAIETAQKFERFFDDIISTDIIFHNDTEKIVEYTVRVKGDTLVVKEGSEDFVKSLNEGADKMIRQIRRWKQKNRN